MEAGALNCPECGAAVTADMPHCPYCRALLKTVACTRCMGMMFLGSKFCPNCGAAAAPVVKDAVSTHPCPRCHTALRRIHIAATSVEECSHCGGLWMSLADFDRICSDTESQTAATGLVLPPPVPSDPHVVYLNCPECRQPMGRTNYAHASGIITSMCRAHGIWLDRDQLRHIVEFIRSGGLEHARRIEKEQLDSARRALERKRSLMDYRGGGSGGSGDSDDD